MTFFTDNIAAVFSHATADDIAAGMSWYAEAHALALEISPDDVWRGAGVIAAFSPQTPWWRNVILARESCRTGVARTDTLGNSTRAAQRILDGADPMTVFGGLKTQAFCDNIALNGISDRCTVDVHAFSIAQGTAVASSALRMGKGLYGEISYAYSEVAESNSMHVPQMQAITWVVWRNMREVSARLRDAA